MTEIAHVQCDREGCAETRQTKPALYGGQHIQWIGILYDGGKVDICSMECLAKWADSQQPTQQRERK